MLPHPSGYTHVEPFRIVFGHQRYLPAEGRRVAYAAEGTILHGIVVQRNVVAGCKCQPVAFHQAEAFGQGSVGRSEVVVSGILEGVVYAYHQRGIPSSLFQRTDAGRHGAVLLVVTPLAVVTASLQQRTAVAQFDKRKETDVDKVVARIVLERCHPVRQVVAAGHKGALLLHIRRRDIQQAGIAHGILRPGFLAG